MTDLNDERIKNGNIIKVIFIHNKFPCLWKVWEHINGIDIEEDGTKYYRALFLYHSCNDEYCNNPHCNSEPYRIKFADYKDFVRCQFKNGYKIKNKCKLCKS